MQMDLELIQTIGIIATLVITTIITIVQLTRTRTSNQINTYIQQYYRYPEQFKKF